MPTTSSGLHYPANTDLVSGGAAAIQLLAEDVEAKAIGLGAQVLGYQGSSINYGPDSTVVAAGTGSGWPSIISCTVSVPAGSNRRILALGYAQISATVVGNVEMAIYDGAATSLAFGAAPDPRISNPTTVSYSNLAIGIQNSPSSGSHTYHLRAKNNAAGSFTSWAHGLLILLL